MAAGPTGARPPVGRTLYSRAVLLDTSAFLALANPHDVHHVDSQDCLVLVARNRLPVFVTLPTVYEAHRRFLFDFGQLSADRFLVEVFDGTTNIVRTIEDDEAEARRLIDRYAALALTLTDAVNMAVMVRLSIAAAFSFDRHYLQAGFIRIPPFHL